MIDLIVLVRQSLIVLCLMLAMQETAQANQDQPDSPVRTPTEEFSLLSQALSGNFNALETVAAEAPQNPMYRWVLANLALSEEQYGKAAEQLQHALRQGNLQAALALALMWKDDGNLVESSAWAKIWVVHLYDLTGVQSGQANRDLGMRLLYENSRVMTNDELARADRRADELIQEWRPETVRELTACPQNRQCSQWQASYNPNPEYPAGPLAAGRTGWVLSLLHINQNGLVEDSRILFSSDQDFNINVSRAFALWRFSPPEDSSEAGTLSIQSIEFTLE